MEDEIVDWYGELAPRARGQPATARLISRKSLALEDQDREAFPCKLAGGGGSGRARPDDDDIVATHWITATEAIRDEYSGLPSDSLPLDGVSGRVGKENTA